MTSKDFIEYMEKQTYTLRTHLNGEPLGKPEKKEKWLVKLIETTLEDLQNQYVKNFK